MVNMQLTAEEAKEYTSVGESDPGDAPKYPYGLSMCLDDESMKKLGMADLPAVGTVMQLSAKVIVTSVGMSQQQDGDPENRTELQITDMDLSGAPRDIAKSLYGGTGA